MLMLTIDYLDRTDVRVHPPSPLAINYAIAPIGIGQIRSNSANIIHRFRAFFHAIFTR